jgi:hypothetical protein
MLTFSFGHLGCMWDGMRIRILRWAVQIRPVLKPRDVTIPGRCLRVLIGHWVVVRREGVSGLRNTPHLLAIRVLRDLRSRLTERDLKVWLAETYGETLQLLEFF